MSVLSSHTQSLLDLLASITHNFNSDNAVMFFSDYGDVLQYVCVLYIVLILLGPRAMEGREACELSGVIRVWNLLLAVFSIAGSAYCVTLLVYMSASRPFYNVVCRFDYSVLYDGAFSFWVFSFMVSKIPEMLDTVFLCLRKKPITFLHAYHHLTVTIFSWNGGRHLLPSGIWFATMNYVVHSFMYSYYFLCSCGLKRVVAPIAPLITGLQIAQMVFGYAICLYTAYHKFVSPYGCETPAQLIRMGLLMYGSYFFLFVGFFISRYGKEKSRRPRKTSAETAIVERRPIT
ncbi:putative mitochondrial fatty acid elongase [Leptomonas pyrrhocoris]|uniref:Elongation of fatty acids protein n=1 Tax=Leptomonas pyrrhocoris TaxID=157538 RepID=A0A0M9G836_LEPPY|nr:putative mitochondrial fatty acid elongase [Leptomonas pyrrhocoris]KPA84533.1 putative mitochondrial fatty acid elongase [Leptomonas pyrrhocoris]|eukprot:XP_015662972.1 putative mitochondrial fatty acid elongase [Leptomonas pyrrhocoris]